MSKFFINRPIVAIVIAILMVLVGVVAILGLPTAQFPNIADPMIQVKATYPGADATTIAESVATPIEQQMSGVSGMNYMYSLSASSGGGSRAAAGRFGGVFDGSEGGCWASARQS